MHLTQNSPIEGQAIPGQARTALETCDPASLRVDSLASQQRFIRDVFLTNLPVPVMKFRSYLWLAMLSRSLGPDGYGAWALFHTTLDISTAVASMTLGSSMMRFL